MSKPKITQADMDALIERIEELTPDLRAATDNIRKNIGYADDVTQPLRFVTALANLSWVATDTLRNTLLVLRQEEDRRHIETEIKARVEQEKNNVR